MTSKFGITPLTSTGTFLTKGTEHHIERHTRRHTSDKIMCDKMKDLINKMEEMALTSSEAQSALGTIYYKGMKHPKTGEVIINQDDEKAFMYQKIAFDNKFYQAGLFVTLHYFEGVGVKKDIDKAREYFTKIINIAKEGDLNLCRHLAVFYNQITSANTDKSISFLDEFFLDFPPDIVTWL